MAPTTTVIDAGKDLPDNHTPTFAKEPFFVAIYALLLTESGEFLVHTEISLRLPAKFSENLTNILNQYIVYIQ